MTTIPLIHSHGFRGRTVAEIVNDDSRMAAVFKRFGIDFCCGGRISVDEAAARQGVDVSELEAELLAASGSRRAGGRPDPRHWSLDFLADFIVNEHHRYVRDALPAIRPFARKVADRHGGDDERLVQIHEKVEELAAAMEQHMKDEEEVVFPWIRALAAAKNAGGSVPDPVLESGRDPIPAMEEDHDHAGALLREIRELSDDLTPPAGACNTYRATFELLKEFEDDLHWHVHLENNVLFPAARHLERELRA